MRISDWSSDVCSSDLNARLKPNDYLVALKGMASGINFATANPAHIIAADGTYRLAPTRIDFDKGSLRVAGSYGSGMAVQSRLDKLDLSILNAFVPDLNIGGAATGRSEEHTSEPQSLMRIPYAVFCLKKKNKQKQVA